MTTVGGAVSTLSTCVGIYMTIRKSIRESREERVQIIAHQNQLNETLTKLTNDVRELVIENEAQQKQLEATESFAKSHFRMELYNALTKALERGYTFVDEATEIAKMYTIYHNNGGNGEIKLLYSKYDKLEIKEERYNDF
jgi:predicted GNAT superfamily acetyltransferase|nr:MAG TPA: hypothetical protein [Bacteriophage sp.]DAX75311.1 MAG TPA: hypothetical protein [Bacteriophage sp.]